MRTLKSSCTGGAGEQADDTCESYSTVAILAQGTNWADAFTQAFLLGGPTSTVCAERSDPAIAVQSVNVIETNLRLRVSVATLRGAPVHVQFVLATVAARYRVALLRVGDYPLKNNGSHIDASLSRQPLVKGERLVRAEMNAVITTYVATATYSAF